MHPEYLSYEQRTPDSQPQDTLRLVRKHGKRSKTQQGEDSFSLPYPVVHVHPLSQGYPWCTLRNIRGSGFMSIDELQFMINGEDSNEVLNKKYGVPFWNDTFKDPEKCRKRGLPPNTMGPASYGPVLHHFPFHGWSFIDRLKALFFPQTFGFNQVQAVIDQIKELPHLKTHIMTTLFPPGIFRGTGKVQKVVTVPCHGTVALYLVLDGRLYLIMVQRSGDLLPAALNHNKIQWAAQLLMMAQITGYVPDTFSHVILNPHIYERQLPYVDEVLSREPRPYPTVRINDPSIKDIFSFRKQHFTLEDYNPHSAIKGIPVSQ